MPKNEIKVNFKKGIAAKSIIILLAVVIVISLISGSLYWVWMKYFLYPDFFDAFNRTLETKMTHLSDFDFDAFGESGKNIINFGIPEEDLKSTITLERKSQSSRVVIDTGEDTLTGIQKYYVFGFYDGILKSDHSNLYASSVLTFEEDFNNSIFCPDSNSEHEMSQKQADTICSIANLLAGSGENSGIDFLKNSLKDAIKNSNISTTYKTYKENITLLTESRYCKVEEFSFDKNDVATILDSVAGDISINKNEDSNSSILRLSADSLSLYAEKLKSNDDLMFEFVVKIFYSGDYVSGMIIDYTYSEKVNKSIKVEDLEIGNILNYKGDSELSGTITIDFGAFPSKTRDIHYENLCKGILNGQEYNGTSLIFSSERAGDSINYYVKGDINSEKTETSFYMNNSAGEAVFHITKENSEIVNIKFDFSDSADKMSFKLKTVEFNGKEIEFPYSFDVTFYTEAEIIRLGQYTSFLFPNEDYKEKDYQNFKSTVDKWESIYDQWKIAMDKANIKFFSNIGILSKAEIYQ